MCATLLNCLLKSKSIKSVCFPVCIFLAILSTSITNWVSQDLFSLNPCCSSNSMLELANCLVKLDAIMCSSTSHKTHEWYGGDKLSPFLKMGDIFASFQIKGSFLESTDFWKITCSIGASSTWGVCGTMGLNWSGPAALWWFRDLSSFSIPFTEICISDIWLYGLDWKGKLHPWSFSSWSFRWAKELKRSRYLWLKTDWNCLFRAFDFSQSSERVLLSDFSVWVVNTSF